MDKLAERVLSAAVLALVLALSADSVRAQPPWISLWQANPALGIAGAQVRLGGVTPGCSVELRSAAQTPGQVLRIELLTGSAPADRCFAALRPWFHEVLFPNLAAGTYQVSIIEVPRNPAVGGPAEVLRFPFEQTPEGAIPTAARAVPSGRTAMWLVLALAMIVLAAAHRFGGGAVPTQAGRSRRRRRPGRNPMAGHADAAAIVDWCGSVRLRRAPEIQP